MADNVINYAKKYSNEIQDKFTLSAQTNPAFTEALDFTGVKTVIVYSIPTVPLVPYTRSGLNRYGIPDDLGDTIQQFELQKDDAFTVVIDLGDFKETLLLKTSGRFLERQISHVVTPSIDQFRISMLVSGAGKIETVPPAEITPETSYKLVLDGIEHIRNNNVPEVDTYIFMSYSFWNLLKQSNSYIRQGNTSQQYTTNGGPDYIENTPVIKLPSSYFPEKVNFIITHTTAAWAAQTVSDYIVHENPPGVSGSLIQGRIIYGCNIFEQKRQSVYVNMSE